MELLSLGAASRAVDGSGSDSSEEVRGWRRYEGSGQGGRGICGVMTHSVCLVHLRRPDAAESPGLSPYMPACYSSACTEDSLQPVLPPLLPAGWRGKQYTRAPCGDRSHGRSDGGGLAGSARAPGRAPCTAHGPQVHCSTASCVNSLGVTWQRQQLLPIGHTPHSSQTLILTLPLRLPPPLLLALPLREVPREVLLACE